MTGRRRPRVGAEVGGREIPDGFMSQREFLRLLGKEPTGENSGKTIRRKFKAWHRTHPGNWRFKLGGLWMVNPKRARRQHPEFFGCRPRANQDDVEDLLDGYHEMRSRLSSLAAARRQDKALIDQLQAQVAALLENKKLIDALRSEFRQMAASWLKREGAERGRSGRER